MTSYVMCNKKKLGIKKSDIGLLKKSVEDRKLEYFKSELLKILDKKEKEENGEEVSKSFVVQELYKSMTDPLYMAKGGKVGVVGEVRTWNGKKYKKMPNKKWVRIYDTRDRHTEISIARLKGKVRKAQSVDELFEIVMNNTHRFSDENGKPLDIVLELKKEVDARKKALNAGKPSTKEQIKKEQKKKNQKIELTEKQKENLEKINDILDKNVETFPVGEFSEENFKKLFENGIDSPIEHIKIGENQYQKLIEKNRQDLIAAMADVMKNPALIMKTDTGAKVYTKTYERKNHKKTVISVIVDKGKLHISISTHIEKNKQLAKKMDSILFDRTESVHGDNASQEKTPDNSSIAQDYNDVNKKEKSYNRQQDEGQPSTKQKEQKKYAKDVCKNISELKNYAKDKYNLDIVVRHGEVPFEQCLKSFVEIEKMTEDFPDLPKFIQRIQYSKPGAKWAGLYNSSSTGEYSLCIGNIEQIKKDIGDTKRPFTRGRSIEAVTRHEAGHAISEMLFKAYGEKFGIKPFDKAFEYWFYNSKENKAQNYREKYGTFENFKKEGDKTEIVSAHSRYEIAENHVRIKYHEESCDKVNKLIIDEALKSLGIGDKRRARRSQYPTENELEKYPSLSEMWDISRYAMTSDAECIAEGVSDYLTNGEKAQKLSKAIYKVLLSKIDNGIKKSCLVRVEEIKKHFLQIWG